MTQWWRANRPLRIGGGIAKGEIFPGRPGANYRTLRAHGAVSPVRPEDVPEDADPHMWGRHQQEVAPPAPEVQFASEAAKALAAGLSEEDFEGHTPSGKSGFTASDVRSIIEHRDKTVLSDTVELTPEQIVELVQQIDDAEVLEALARGDSRAEAREILQQRINELLDGEEGGGDPLEPPSGESSSSSSPNDESEIADPATVEAQ